MREFKEGGYVYNTTVVAMTARMGRLCNFVHSPAQRYNDNATIHALDLISTHPLTVLLYAFTANPLARRPPSAPSPVLTHPECCTKRQYQASASWTRYNTSAFSHAALLSADHHPFHRASAPGCCAERRWRPSAGCIGHEARGMSFCVLTWVRKR